MINEFKKGLKTISKIKPAIINPISINNDWSALKRKKYDTLLFLTRPIKIAKNNNKFPNGIDLSINIIGMAGIWMIWIKGYFIYKWFPKVSESDHGIIYRRIPNILPPSEGIINFIFFRLKH